MAIKDNYIKANSAVILINLGTPEKLSTTSIRTFLDQFLMDWRVVKIPYLLRYMLVKLIIKPFRPRKILKNYSSIWKKEGSPLMIYAKSLKQKVQKQLSSQTVDIAMRYGQPSIKSVMHKHIDAGITDFVIVPLFPQYASATTGSLLENLFRGLIDKWHIPSVKVVKPYYDNHYFIKAQAKLAEKYLKKDFDHYLFSYHGLPKKHLKLGTYDKQICQEGACCNLINKNNSYCYRAQCIHTTKALIKELKLDSKKCQSVFQSRFGPEPWLEPYLDKTVEKLAKEGKKNILVFSPSFVADCVETLEEVAIGAKEIFIENGGKDLLQVPCVNDSDLWAKNLVKIIEDYL